ncbi:MAG: DUF1566 domain-containing protein [Deltaproteobacteria bacterium]|jgi:hypothetical protein|nr:DUF1566 domain-containing protein [Deltaproteobacteria bacterium]
MSRPSIHPILATAVLLWVAPAVHAAAPSGRYTTTSTTVLDNKTGLTWQRSPGSTTYTRSQAGLQCSSGWRLPSVTELATIVDVSQQSPAIDASAFPSTPYDLPFWSATMAVPDSTTAWVVDFTNGELRTYPESAALYVRCVR